MKKEGRVGTGFVPREAWGDEEEICLSRLRLNSWKRGRSRLMRTIVRSEGIWVHGVIASTGARWLRAGAQISRQAIGVGARVGMENS